RVHGSPAGVRITARCTGQPPGRGPGQGGCADPGRLPARCGQASRPLRRTLRRRRGTLCQALTARLAHDGVTHLGQRGSPWGQASLTKAGPRTTEPWAVGLAFGGSAWLGEGTGPGDGRARAARAVGASLSWV